MTNYIVRDSIDAVSAVFIYTTINLELTIVGSSSNDLTKEQLKMFSCCVIKNLYCIISLCYYLCKFSGFILFKILSKITETQ